MLILVGWAGPGDAWTDASPSVIGLHYLHARERGVASGLWELRDRTKPRAASLSLAALFVT